VSCGDNGNPVASTGTTSSVTSSRSQFVGTITDGAGAPVEHAALEIISKDGYPVPEVAVVTDASGAFEGPPLPHGDYTIKATAEGYQPASQDAALTAAKTTQVDFVLAR
jgi:hypothetical protein